MDALLTSSRLTALLEKMLERKTHTWKKMLKLIDCTKARFFL